MVIAGGRRGGWQWRKLEWGYMAILRLVEVNTQHSVQSMCCRVVHLTPVYFC